MSVFVLKIIAMSTMLCDHIGLQFYDNSTVMRNIGRIAFIVYAFLMAEGYIHMADRPERLRAHVVKLFFLTAVSEIAYDLFDHGVPEYPGAQSVIPTLALGFGALILAGWWREKCGKGFRREMGENDPAAGEGGGGSAPGKVPAGEGVGEAGGLRRRYSEQALAAAGCLVIYAPSAYLSYAFRTEYKFAGVLLVVFSYYYLKWFGGRELPVKAIAVTGMLTAYMLVYFWSRSGFAGWSGLYQVAAGYQRWYPGTVLAIVPLALYNRRLGWHSRWFGVVYSWFYPAQFFVLYFAARLMA